MIEQEFIDRYEDLALRIAGRLGFATEHPAGEVVPVSRRLQLVRGRQIRATSAITDLQQWLDDDDESVRRAARSSIHRCLYVAYTGDRPDLQEGRLGRLASRIDGKLAAWLGHRICLDRPEPVWAQPVSVRRTRGLLIAAVVLVAISAGALFALDQPVAALGAVVCLAGLDIGEGSLARVLRMRDAQMRWISCIFSHAADLFVLAGICANEYANGRSRNGSLLLGAGILTLYGSLVRVSALQAGFRFWRSLLERAVRFAAFGCYAVLDLVGGGGTIVVPLLIGGFGLLEAMRVIARVFAGRIGRGGFIFLTDDSAECWSFELDPPATTVLAGRP